MNEKVIALVGPTASGKSGLGVRLAGQFDGQIISGDSIAVYRGFDIGSAKPTRQQQGGITHYLIDELNPDQPYSVYQFQKQGRKLIEQIASAGQLPIIVGGTGLYIKALLYDYTFTEGIAADHQAYADIATATLYQRLVEADPPAAAKIDPHNRQRLVHALAMAESGHSKSAQEAGQSHQCLYDALIIGLTLPKEMLQKRIDQRISGMMADGLAEEVERITAAYGWQISGMKGIGYKEFAPYFAGQQTLEQVAEQIRIHTRQFAKRQYTWWRHQLPVDWYDVSQPGWQDNIERDVRIWLNR